MVTGHGARCNKNRCRDRNAEDNNDPWEFRLGNLGVWGEFKNTTPPSVDVLGVTDTAQVVILDLIKTT